MIRGRANKIKLNWNENKRKFGFDRAYLTLVRIHVTQGGEGKPTCVQELFELAVPFSPREKEREREFSQRLWGFNSVARLDAFVWPRTASSSLSIRTRDTRTVHRKHTVESFLQRHSSDLSFFLLLLIITILYFDSFEKSGIILITWVP